MSVLPPTRDSVLLSHPDAVAAGVIALQQFEPITGWHSDIAQLSRRVFNSLPTNDI